MRLYGTCQIPGCGRMSTWFFTDINNSTETHKRVVPICNKHAKKLKKSGRIVNDKINLIGIESEMDKDNIAAQNLGYLKTWLLDEGWYLETPGPVNAVLQARYPGRKHPFILFDNPERGCFSVLRRDRRIVRKFNRYMREV